MIHQIPRETGWVEVICGSMFSGKTEELIRRVRLAEIARQKVAIFKPSIDNRWSEEHIVSHDKRKLPAYAAKTPKEVFEKALDFDVIGIDEVQFFGKEIIKVVERLANMGKRVIVSGLDQDHLGKPFDPMPQLLAVAEFITKNLAICMVCGNPANRSQRLIAIKKKVSVGGADQYEARCRRCFNPEEPMKEKQEEFEATSMDAAR